MRLTVNDTTISISTSQALTEALTRSAHLPFREIWLAVENGPSICALLNQKTGWLMYLRWSGDAGFSSRNPSYSGADTASIEYELSNGQRDEYPAGWALPEPQIWDALIHFFEYRNLSSSVAWHDDGA